MSLHANAISYISVVTPRACAARGKAIGSVSVCLYVCMYICVQKKNLNHTLAAISHGETMVEGSLFSLLTNAPAVEAIGASCTRQFSRQVFYSINAHHLGLEATPILNKKR